MERDRTYSKLVSALGPIGQDHLLRFWDELDEVGRRNLAVQVASIDFERVAELFHEGAGTHDWSALARRAEPPPARRLAELRKSTQQSSDARQRGAESIAAGKVGVLLVAGGQGSRLGFDHPKGLYPIGPVSGASLLQIHFAKVLAAVRRYGAPVPVYMMTSPVTHDEQA